MTRSTSDRFRLAGCALLVALAVAGLVAAAGTVPHTHAGAEPGLYNQEHDLSLLATSGNAAPLPEGTAPALLLLVAVTVIPLAVRCPAVPARRHADPRAPPVR